MPGVRVAYRLGSVEHEIGHHPPRGIPAIPSDEAERLLSDIAGKPISLGNLEVTEAPESCPACGSSQVFDMRDTDGDPFDREEVHPLVWGEGYATCDSYFCVSCDAGWIEGWKPHPITWVRPWRTS